YYWVYYTLMKFVGRKYNAKYEIIDDVNDCEGPCFVIFNHLSRIDHKYILDITYPKRINMLAGYSEFFRSHLHTVFKMNNILPKKQYINDLTGTKAILSIIRQGGSVAFAPEGLATNDGTNKPIVPHTGHLLKKCGIPVYFVKLRGQYLQNTKHCLDERYGETFASISLLFSPDALAKLSVEEIDAKINEAFRHDEYAWQKEKHIKWTTNGRICHRLEDILYRCPRCNEEFVTEGKGNEFVCKACGNGATVDEYYDFHKFDDDCVIPDTVTDWVTEERMAIIREIRNDENYTFTERVKVGMLPKSRYLKDKKTSEIVGEGLLTIDHTGMRYVDDNDEKQNFFMDYNELYTVITELDSSYFNLYHDGEYRDVFPERKSTIKISMLIEEMHRLHVNRYKNFPWNDFMYKE
ncbi:MAG: hypothetical protein J5903_02505, partial [Clostridia bacterium]|nr:hypothetical protein [Clostridia bacterium]